MRVPRLYLSECTGALVGDVLALSAEQVHHLARVLRRSSGDPLVVFDGAGQSFEATLQLAPKGAAGHVTVGVARPIEPAPATPLWVALAMLKSDTLDYVLQKATELGAAGIQLLETQRSEARLADSGRRERRLAHWRGILIGACEQSGRSWVPQLLAPIAFAEGVAADGQRWLLDPEGERFGSRPPLQGSPLTLAIGPEGGWTELERSAARAAGIPEVSFGPRVLRADTAPVVALALVQHLVGGL